jgi:Mlc titration factor MtfA (ptsG expression regulator)
MFGFIRWLRGRTRVSPAFDDGQWTRALQRCRVVRHLDAAARLRLREQVVRFLGSKQFTAAGGLELTPEMRLTIALQACVPVLELGTDSYAPWVEVIVYPDEFIVERDEVDEAGVVHQVREPLSGESWAGGPVILSWADVEAANPEEGYNVVVHEFAHKLDMLDGVADGMPPLHAGMSRAQWHAAFTEAFDDLVERIECVARIERQAGRARRSAAGQQQSSAALDTRWRQLPMGPYACKDAAEFFACASEVFFEAPERLYSAYPAVYGQLQAFYRQHPLGSTFPPSGR